MQPHYNPINDIQAIHRCYRQGQTQVVHVYRPLIKDTVEAGIAKRAANKLEVVSVQLGHHQLRHFKCPGLDDADIEELVRM